MTGLALGPNARVAWRDTAHVVQDYRLKGPANQHPVALKAANRLVVAETRRLGRRLPPAAHLLLVARGGDQRRQQLVPQGQRPTFTIGIRQGEQEVVEQYLANWSLYSAPPGTVQRMAAFFYPTLGTATWRSGGARVHTATIKPLPGYKVMGRHYHTSLGERLLAAGTSTRG